MQNMLQRWFRERHSQFWDERESENSTDTFGRLPYQLWNVSKYGSCVDAAITGLMPPPLLELQVIFYFLTVSCCSTFFSSFYTKHTFLLGFVVSWTPLTFTYSSAHTKMNFYCSNEMLFLSYDFQKFSEVILVFEFSCFYCWAVKSALLLCNHCWSWCCDFCLSVSLQYIVLWFFFKFI